jgi:tetratricopeptide (TPR) repeat protein
MKGELALAQLRADGNSHFAAGEYEAALTDYQSYLERKPDAVDVRRRTAETLLRLGRPGEAEAYTRAVYDVDPTRLEHAGALARAKVQAGEIGEGLDFMRRYLQDHPTGEGYYLLGEIATEAGLPDDALVAYKIADELDGDTSAEPHRRLARFYEAHDRAEEATTQWRAVLWFDQSDAEARSALRALGHVPGPSFALSPSEID